MPKKKKVTSSLFFPVSTQKISWFSSNHVIKVLEYVTTNCGFIQAYANKGRRMEYEVSLSPQKEPKFMVY